MTTALFMLAYVAVGVVMAACVLRFNSKHNSHFLDDPEDEILTVALIVLLWPLLTFLLAGALVMIFLHRAAVWLSGVRR